MTDPRWQKLAAAAPLGLAVVVGGATWVTITASADGATTPASGDQAAQSRAEAANLRQQHMETKLRHAIRAESRQVKRLEARLGKVRTTTRVVRASIPSAPSTGSYVSGTTSTSSGSGSWQAPSVPSSQPAPANPPTTHTTTGASGTTKP